MPECKLGMNDKAGGPGGGEVTMGQEDQRAIALDDCRFHQCVRLSKYDQERMITFVPPDGEFELMTYRITEAIGLPFKVFPVITEHRQRVEYRVKVQNCMVKGDPEIEDIVVRIPVPKNTSKVKLHTQSRGSMGKMKYEAAQLCWVWRCKSMTAGTELTLSAEAELLQTAGGNANWVR